MEKIKKYAKYITNILAFINAIILVLIPIWNLPDVFNLISDTIVGINGVIAVYLLGSKVSSK